MMRSVWILVPCFFVFVGCAQDEPVTPPELPEVEVRSLLIEFEEPREVAFISAERNDYDGFVRITLASGCDLSEGEDRVRFKLEEVDTVEFGISEENRRSGVGLGAGLLYIDRDRKVADGMVQSPAGKRFKDPATRSLMLEPVQKFTAVLVVQNSNGVFLAAAKAMQSEFDGDFARVKMDGAVWLSFGNTEATPLRFAKDLWLDRVRYPGADDFSETPELVRMTWENYAGDGVASPDGETPRQP